jgi:hypothetical protein
MSAVDDILFAPIERWCDEVDLINRVYQNDKHAPVARFTLPARPMNALDLETLCRLYHVKNHAQFYVVVYRLEIPRPVMEAFLFDGKLVIETDPYLKVYPIRSIRDINLYPNQYNGSYVFRDYFEAAAYHRDITDGLDP